MHNLRFDSKSIKKIILYQSKRANVGHIGSALCISEILTVLYRDVLKIEDYSSNQRDRFILSKGHAGLALYAALQLKGLISSEEVDSFCSNGSLLGVHPEQAIKGVDFSIGSLGHGLSIGAGCALAARMQKSDRKVYVLLSDAELNEGSVWEAAMFAAHHKLNNLIAIVDVNSQQALGYTKDILNLEPLAEKWRAFGWHAEEINGNDEDELSNYFLNKTNITNMPHVLLARTVFGKGISFMENKIKWHYWPMSDDEYQTALAELER